MGAENPFGGFDKYFLYAQAAPALIAALPLSLGVLTMAAKETAVLGTVVTVTATCCAAIPLSHEVRRRGRKAEARLISAADGWPTTRFLRHRDAKLAAKTRERYHAKLALLVPGVRLPTADDEAKDPADADAVYGTCVDKVRELTRDATKFGLILQNNCDYGFRRNCLGIRPFGRLASVVGVSLSLWWWTHHKPAESTVLAAAAAGIIALLFLWWFFVVNDAYVHDAADRYAERLLAACDNLEPPAAQSQPPLPERLVLLPHETLGGRR